MKSAVLLACVLSLGDSPTPPASSNEDRATQVASQFAKAFCDSYDFAKIEKLLAKDVRKLKTDGDDGRSYIKRNGPMFAKGNAKTVKIIGQAEGKIDEWLTEIRAAAPDYYRDSIPANAPSETLSKTWPNLFAEIKSDGVPYCIIAEVGEFRGGVIIVVRKIEDAYRISLVDDE